MTTTTTATREQATETQTKTTATEICFGAFMGIAAIAGIWGAVSLMINYFIG